MRDYLLIFIGGGIGSLFRFFVSNYFNPLMTVFPLGTLISNVVSSFILGLAVGLIQNKYPENSFVHPFIIVGICGGFSTFSTFSNETLTLLKTGSYSPAILNILINIILCIIFIVTGIRLTR